MSGSARYQEQLRESASLVAARLGMRDWALVFQSRSGRPQDPWLGPDICDYLRAERAGGLQAAVVCPIGFLCDHIEVLYDLDHEAALASPGHRASDGARRGRQRHPRFLDTMADAVTETWRRYENGLALPLVSAAPPETDGGSARASREFRSGLGSLVAMRDG